MVDFMVIVHGICNYVYVILCVVCVCMRSVHACVLISVMCMYVCMYVYIYICICICICICIYIYIYTIMCVRAILVISGMYWFKTFSRRFYIYFLENGRHGRQGQFGSGSTPKFVHYILIYRCVKIGAFIKKCTIG